VIWHRCFACARRARAAEPDGPLWFPRAFQGEGRHDNPDLYGCLYVSAEEVSVIAEQLAPFRGQRLAASLLVRRGLPLALAAIELDDAAGLVDLDDPAVLTENALRPSRVATRRRELTQAQARTLFERRPEVAGLRWWSTYESLWANVTLWDRAAAALRVVDVRELTVADPAVREAAELLGL